MRLLDAHCHCHDLEPPDWRRARPTLDAIGWAGAVVNGAYPDDWPLVRAFADREAGGGVQIVKAYGVHPWHLDKIDAGDDWLRRLRHRLDAEPDATIGEIGIDRAFRGRDEAEWDRAERVFLAQVDEAALRDRAMTVHCVKAHDRLWELLRRRGLPRRGFLLHGWSGPSHLVAKFASLGACFSFSACTLTRRKPRASLPLVPPDRVLMETDAPYMTPPQTARRYELTDASGQPINHPANLAAAYDTAAQLLNTPVDALATQIAANFDRLFAADR